MNDLKGLDGVSDKDGELFQSYNEPASVPTKVHPSNFVLSGASDHRS